MKTKAIRSCALVLVCVLALTLMLTGCSGKFKSVSDYLADPDVAEQIDSEIAAVEGTGLTVKVYADGSTLVYEYGYEDQLDLSDETVKQSIVNVLADACVEQAATFVGVAEALRGEIDANDIKVRLIYNNADGSEIYACEFE
ncbi:MAG: DUF4854 domain-containing protein [Hominenteromicrobium sp.]